MTKDCIDQAVWEDVHPDPVEVTPVAISHSLNALRRDLDVGRDDAVLGEVFALFHWAVRESRKGRVILSGDPERGNLRRIRMPILERVFRT
jgi:hypothetical protein